MHTVTGLQKRGLERCVSIAAPSTAFERHFMPEELGKIWRYHKSTIRRMFQDEPGVLKMGKANRRDGKRDYVTLRIPESVALRVYEERSG